MATGTGAGQLTDLTVAAMGAAMRAGDTTPVELVDAHLHRIEQLDSDLNAFVTLTAEQAREDAERMSKELRAGTDRGPLHGVPIVLKDLIDTAGVTTAGGAAVYRDRVPDRDATVTARLRAAGAIVLGKTNTHELAFGVTTENPHFGTTRNPWDHDRIAGGSSGGTAAAVCAGLGAAGIGTDTGGSIRIPSSMCGVVGLKPTRGLVPTTGVIPLSRLLDHVGPIARTVEDAAIMLSAIVGYDPSDPATLPLPVPDYRASLSDGLTGLRVGVPRSTAWLLLEDDVRSVCEAALEIMAELGADVVDVALPDPTAGIGIPGSTGGFSVAVEESRWAHREAWAQSPDAFGADVAALYSLPTLDASAVIESLELMASLSSDIRHALTEVDVLAMPTLPMVATPIGSETVTIAGLELPLIAAAIANTVMFNVAGVPAISVPAGLGTAGLPVGLQLAGPPLGEAMLLRVAHAFEAASGWAGFTVRPPE